MKFRTVATGGTFDHLHKGHEALISKSFEVGERVVVGVTSDSFVRREGKTPDQTYSERVRALELYIRTNFPGREYRISKLDDYFGPGIASPEVEAIVVSTETEPRVEIANKLREEKGFPPLKVVVLDYVLAEDGTPISSSRIRNGEIDESGELVGTKG
ncbi:MAG TPA: pantetheine-phosphate adenylyltransferase [Nitrososphaerales archaeon]|nr:pantetheine-phosphate adenylyltransferase [Nitrososphaerales archaeon]